MLPVNAKNDRLFTVIIILISILGITYFGYRAIREGLTRRQENPFEYNVEHFKETDNQLHHYTEAGHIPIPMERVYGLTVTADGRIAVSGDDSVLLLDMDGTIRSSIPVGSTVRCLTEDEEKKLYLGTADHVEVYDSKFVKKAAWPSLGEKALITSLDVFKDDVYIADAGNRIVWKFDKSGNLKGEIGERDESKAIPGFVIPSPYFDLAVDPDGFLWVANTGRHSLENYTPEGDFRSSWGKFSMQIDGFCGCCNPSHILILDDGSFVTSEKGIPRVKVHNALGELTSIVAGSHQFDEGTVGLDLARDAAQRIFVLDPSRRAVRIFVRHGNE